LSVGQALARVLDSCCLVRYSHLYDSDARVFSDHHESGVHRVRDLLVLLVSTTTTRCGKHEASREIGSWKLLGSRLRIRNPCHPDRTKRLSSIQIHAMSPPPSKRENRSAPLNPSPMSPGSCRPNPFESSRCPNSCCSSNLSKIAMVADGEGDGGTPAGNRIWNGLVIGVVGGVSGDGSCED
ncbi:hypothetical protein LINPERPRIM_LOCUS594, partial [Linum perenne]